MIEIVIAHIVTYFMLFVTANSIKLSVFIVHLISKTIVQKFFICFFVISHVSHNTFINHCTKCCINLLLINIAACITFVLSSLSESLCLFVNVWNTSYINPNFKSMSRSWFLISSFTCLIYLKWSARCSTFTFSIPAVALHTQ